MWQASGGRDAMADPPPEVIRTTLEWWEGFSNVVRNIAFIAGACLAAYGLWLARERTTAASQQAKTAARQAETAAKRLEVQAREDVERRVTEAFTRAIEQLGSDRPEVRLGGIYALERISQESEEFHWPIMETLTAYVRENAPWPPRKDNGQALERNPRRIQSDDPTADPTLAKALDQHKPPATDIAAILTVLGRRSEQERDKDKIEKRHLDLSRTDLRWAALIGAELPAVNFNHATLDHAWLTEANLEQASLFSASLKGGKLVTTILHDAFLGDADLQGANLYAANLRMARLPDANLKRANLGRAKLQGALLIRAKLQGADLGKANLERADLAGADLTDAKGLTQKQLDEAFGDDNTKLPEGLTIKMSPDEASKTEDGTEQPPP
jgi:uncharacterized protein YjbI with pentapeptide repeats